MDCGTKQARLLNHLLIGNANTRDCSFKKCNGAIAVPITYLDKHNPDDFEIISANSIKTNKSVPEKKHGLIKDKEATITINNGCEVINNQSINQSINQSANNLRSNCHQKENVMELWEFRYPSLISSVQNSLELSGKQITVPTILSTCLNQQSINEKFLNEFLYKKCNGIMGVPVTFLDKHNPEQFEIVGLVNGKDDLVDIPTTKNYKNFLEYNQAGNLTGSTGTKIYGNPVLKGKPLKGNYFSNGVEYVYSAYARILIKPKKTGDIK